MDRLAITGLIVALLAILGGFAIEGGAISSLFHLSAFLIVFGGTMGAVMLQTPNKDFINGIKSFSLVWQPQQLDYMTYKNKLCYWADVARQKGFLALESDANGEQDPFVKKGLTMVVDGVDNDVLVEALELEIEQQSERKLKAAQVYQALGGYSPTLGIVGAVLGLIQAMANIDDPQLLGGAIATAFVATIYGVGAANLLFIPVAEKLKAQVENEITFRDMITRGLVYASNGENPRNIDKKLSAYIDLS